MKYSIIPSSHHVVFLNFDIPPGLGPMTDSRPIFWQPKAAETHMFEAFWIHSGLLECLWGGYWMHFGTIVVCIRGSQSAIGQLLGTN